MRICLGSHGKEKKGQSKVVLGEEEDNMHTHIHPRREQLQQLQRQEPAQEETATTAPLSEQQEEEEEQED